MGSGNRHLRIDRFQSHWFVVTIDERDIIPISVALLEKDFSECGRRPHASILASFAAAASATPHTAGPVGLESKSVRCTGIYFNRGAIHVSVLGFANGKFVIAVVLDKNVRVSIAGAVDRSAGSQASEDGKRKECREDHDYSMYI